MSENASLKRLESECTQSQHAIMKLRVLAIVLLLLVPLARAAEMTVAWSVPLDYVAPSQKSWRNIPKLEQPPGQSAFFHPGDELWDLSRGFMGMRVEDGSEHEAGLDPSLARLDPADLKGFRKWPGKWLVWNARSGMLVARGSETDILMTEELMNFANLPVILRTKLELLSGPEGKLRTVAVGTQGGELATAEAEGLKMEIAPLDGGHSGHGEARLKAAWEVNGGPWSLDTVFTVHFGERIRIATHGRGEEHWELFATLTREFFHGVPVSESRLRETVKGIEPWLLGSTEPSLAPEPVDLPAPDDSLKLKIYRVPPQLLQIMGIIPADRGSDSNPVDPFDDGDRPTPPPVGTPPLPPGWEGWTPGCLDVSGSLKRKGITFEKEGSFAFFNPRTKSLLLSTTLINHDQFETLVQGLDCYVSNDIWVSSNPESGGWGLTARSGELAKLSGKREGKEMSFEIEPTLGDSGLVELRYAFDSRAEAGGGIDIVSCSTLLKGCPQTIGSHQVSGKDEQKVVLTASYLYD